MHQLKEKRSKSSDPNLQLIKRKILSQNIHRKRFNIVSGLDLENKSMRAALRNKEKKVQKKDSIMIFPKIFPNPRAFGMLYSPIQHMVLKVLTENKVFCFSKRALRVRTARNKCLKKAMRILH